MADGELLDFSDRGVSAELVPDFSDRASDRGQFANPRDALRSLFGDNFTITSAKRTPADQARLIREGKHPAKNSDHLTGNAFDVVVPGRSTAEVAQAMKDAGLPSRIILDEGDHVHWSFPHTEDQFGDLDAAPAPAAPIAPVAPVAGPAPVGGPDPSGLDFSSRGRVGDVVTSRKRTFGERFSDNAEDALHNSLVGAGAEALTAQVAQSGALSDTADEIRAANADRQEAFDLRSKADPWYKTRSLELGSIAGHPITVTDPLQGVNVPIHDPAMWAAAHPAELLAGAATLGGQLFGSAGSPESYFGGEGSLLRRMLVNAGVNAAVDPVVQAERNAGGSQDGYDPMRTAAAAAVGAAFPLGHDVLFGDTTARAVGGAVKFLRDRFSDGGEPNRGMELDFSDHGTPAPDVEPEATARTGGPAPTTVEVELLDGRRVQATTDNLPTGYMVDPATGERGELNVNAGQSDLDMALYGPNNPALTGEQPGQFAGSAKSPPASGGATGLQADPGGAEVIDFPGAGRSGPEGRAAPQASPEDADAPFGRPGEPAPVSAAPEAPAASTGPDITDQALDVLRSGDRVRVDNGPSLAQFIRKQGGLRDEGGELAGMDADFGKVGRNRITRKAGGLSLEDMAQRAHEAGYFPEVVRPTMDGADNMQAVSGDDLLGAIRDELAGKPRYAGEPDAHAAELQSHVQDLDELLGMLGANPKDHTNAELRRIMDEFFRAPDQETVAGRSAFDEDHAQSGVLAMRAPQNDRGPVSPEVAQPLSEPVKLASGMHDQGLIPGVQPVSRSARDIASAIKAREARRGAAAMPEGGLFDETAKAQGSLFDEPRAAKPESQGRLFMTDPTDHPGPFKDGQLRPIAHLGSYLKAWTPEARMPEVRFDAGELHPDAAATLRASHPGWATAPSRVVMPFKTLMHVLEQRPQVKEHLATDLQHVLTKPDQILPNPTAPAGVDPWSRPWFVGRLGRDRAAAVIEMKIDGDRLEVASVIAPVDNSRINKALRVKSELEGREAAEAGIVPSSRLEGEPQIPVRDFPVLNSDAEKIGPEGGAVKPDADEQAIGDDLGQSIRDRYESTKGGHRGQPAPVVGPRDPAKLDKLAKGVSDLAEDLRQTLGITHRQGRVRGRKALGEYDTATAVIRTRAVHELDTFAHEAGHKLDFDRHPEVSKAIKAHKATLEPFDYDDVRKDVREGFAEWFRWYITNPTYAKKQAPGFYEAFEKAIRTDSTATAVKLLGVQHGYQALLRAPSVERTGSAIVSAGKTSTVEKMAEEARQYGPAVVYRWTDELYRRALDDLHPVQMAVRDLLQLHEANHGKKLDLKVARNPYALGRMSRGAAAAAHMDLTRGVVPVGAVDPEGPALSDALTAAFGDKGWKDEKFAEFGNYLTARRMVHEWDRYFAGELEREPHSFTQDDWRQTITDLEKTNPAYKEAAEQVYDWTRNLWRKERDAGFLTEETYQAGLTDHQDYVPLMRDMSDKDRAGGKPTSGNQKYAGGAKRFKGSTRDIINPIQSLMQRAYQLNVLHARNEVMDALHELAKSAGPGSGAIVERLPAHEVRRFTVDAVEAVERAAQSAGLSTRDVNLLTSTLEAALGDNTETSVFKAGEMNERGEPIIFLWKNGKKIPLRLADGDYGKHMFEALTGMNNQAKNLFVQIASVPSKVLRLGVTTHPEFMVANFLRDQVATWINSDVGFVPGVHGLQGVGEELAQGRISQLYNTSRGIVGGAAVASLDKGRINRDIAALKKNGKGFRRFASFEGLIKASELTETGSRLGVFRLAFKRAKARGLTDYEAALEASYTARDLLDFDRRGANMLSAIRTVTFLNASLQGLDKARRVLSGDGAATAALRRLKGGSVLSPTEKRALVHSAKAWSKVAAIGVMGAMLTAQYADDPEYQEIPDYLRATHWMVKAGGHWLAVPKPFELAFLSNVFERAYEAEHGKDPKAWGRLVSGLGEIMLPPADVTALAVPFDLARNRDHFGRPIVPDYLRENTEPELQFNAYTSEFSKKLGAAIHVSPAVIDYVITGYGGSLGRTALGATQLALKPGQAKETQPEDAFVSRRFVRDPYRGGVSTKEFWDQVGADGGKMTRAEGTFRNLVKSGDTERALAYLNGQPKAVREYVQSAIAGQNFAKANPLKRAETAVKTISDLRKDLDKGPIKASGGGVVRLSQHQQAEADRLLEHLEVAEQRDALIRSGVEGWTQKQAMDIEALHSRLDSISPDLRKALEVRLNIAGVSKSDVAERAWTALQPRLEERGAEWSTQILEHRQNKGRAGALYRFRQPPPNALVEQMVGQ